ncbi:MAG TPA: DUF86 domain-containing protein [Chloroflexia bacterium]|nr:DUF86 domain-containing protein [Chloroflexia bacterium]
MKDDRLYLIHISECIARIEQYTSEGRERFLEDAKTQDAVLRNLQVLAESTQRLSESTKSEHAAIDWPRIAGFRNVLVHDYLGVNLVRVWEIVEHNLPALKNEVAFMLQQEDRANGT